MFGPGSLFVRLAAMLLGGPIRTDLKFEGTWLDKLPARDGCLRSPATPPHQDAAYSQGENAATHKVLDFWLPFQHTTRDNGGLIYYTQIHRYGLCPHHRPGVLGFSKGIADDDLERYQKQFGGDTVQVDAERGDLICHHAFVIHRSAANRTPDRHRRSLGGAIVSTVPWPVPEWTNAEPRL